MSKKAGRHSQSANDFLEPFKPTIGTATDVAAGRAFNNGAASVTFTDAPDSPPATSYTVTSTPGSFTGSGSSSPVTVEGLQSGTSYTFKVVAANSVGNSPESDASNSITATTVPQKPSAPSLSNNGQEVNAVSWSAPGSNGGSGITGYQLTDHENDVTSYDSSTFSANLSENSNEVQFVKLRAQNANGFSEYSDNSNSITTTPFSFSPFGFTPFGFTPFGFTPFGFTPFGFTPKSVGAETVIKSKNPEGLILAHNLSVGDVLYSANIEGIDVANSEIAQYLQNWSTASAQISPAETTIVAMAARISNDGAIVVNGNKYSSEHFLLVKREGQIQFQPAREVLETDLVFSPSENDWKEVTDYKITDQKELLISIDVEPYDLYFTDNALVHDSYPAASNPNALLSSDEQFSDKLDIMYQQWRDSQDQA
jgi:hypothetical protein